MKKHSRWRTILYISAICAFIGILSGVSLAIVVQLCELPTIMMAPVGILIGIGGAGGIMAAIANIYD